MKFRPHNPPRRFPVGVAGTIEIADCGRLELEPNEMVTFVTGDGKQYDVGAKDWGFYATPSVNHRLKRQGFKTAVVRNAQGRFYVVIVNEAEIARFHEYADREHHEVCEWLDER